MLNGLLLEERLAVTTKPLMLWGPNILLHIQSRLIASNKGISRSIARIHDLPCGLKEGKFRGETGPSKCQQKCR
jgi:hypothetical protein